MLSEAARGNSICKEAERGVSRANDNSKRHVPEGKLAAIQQPSSRCAHGYASVLALPSLVFPVPVPVPVGGGWHWELQLLKVG
jgi:hypothetical protein